MLFIVKVVEVKTGFKVFEFITNNYHSAKIIYDEKNAEKWYSQYVVFITEVITCC